MMMTMTMTMMMIYIQNLIMLCIMGKWLIKTWSMETNHNLIHLLLHGQIQAKLTHKWLEMPACILCTVATDTLALGGTAAATIVSMAAAKKAQQNVFALYHSYNHTILLEFIWILDFHFKIVLMLRRRYLIPMRCNNGKRKMWPWRWLHHFDFQPWRWLHALMTMVALFRAGNFWHTHSRSPAPKYAKRLYDCCQVWYV